MEPVPAESSESVSRRDALKNLAFILVAIGIAYAVTRYIGLERIEETVEGAGWWGPLAIIALKMTTIIVVPLGGGPLYAIAGAVFGFWEGMLYTVIGDILGFSAAFFLSRWFGRSVAFAFIPRSQIPNLEKILAQASVTRSFLKARFAFLGLPELFAYAAGLTAVAFPFFLAAQVIPHVLVAAPLVFFGDLLLSFADNPYALIFVTAGTILVAFVFGWWFKKDFVQTA